MPLVLDLLLEAKGTDRLNSFRLGRSNQSFGIM
jgi:hypothetical protein